jgi:hypothetical protein
MQSNSIKWCWTHFCANDGYVMGKGRISTASIRNQYKSSKAKQCVYNITLRRVRATIVAVENIGYYTTCVGICSLRYLACNAQALYCHLWPATLYNIFPHYYINGKIFKKVTGRKTYVLIFSTTLSETFLIPSGNERDMTNKLYWSSLLYSCPILTKLEFFRRIFGKSSNIEFHENSSSGSRVVPYGRKDGQTWRSK